MSSVDSESNPPQPDRNVRETRAAPRRQEKKNLDSGDMIYVAPVFSTLGIECGKEKSPLERVSFVVDVG